MPSEMFESSCLIAVERTGLMTMTLTSVVWPFVRSFIVDVTPKRKYKIRLTVFAPTVHNFTPSRAHAQANSLPLSIETKTEKNDRNKWIVLVLVCPHSRFCLFLDVKWITKYFNQNQCACVCMYSIYTWTCYTNRGSYCVDILLKVSPQLPPTAIIGLFHVHG